VQLRGDGLITALICASENQGFEAAEKWSPTTRSAAIQSKRSWQAELSSHSRLTGTLNRGLAQATRCEKKSLVIS
jgi:hypothetical protein